MHQDNKTSLDCDEASTLRLLLSQNGNRSSSSSYCGNSPQRNWIRQSSSTCSCRKPSRPWPAIVAVFMLTSTLWGAIFMLWQSDLLTRVKAGSSASLTTSVVPYDLGEQGNILANKHYISCGSSTEEARSKGCVYDILANHYVHALCFDNVSTQSYMSEGTSWMGYLDQNKTTRLTTIEEMGDYDVYWTSQRDHIVHCGEMWKRQYRAFTQNWRFVDPLIANEEHTFHCADYLVRMTDWDVIAGRDWRQEPNTVEVGFAGCYDRAVSKAKASS